jgi:hypothetical protein
MTEVNNDLAEALLNGIKVPKLTAGTVNRKCYSQETSVEIEARIESGPIAIPVSSLSPNLSAIALTKSHRA